MAATVSIKEINGASTGTPTTVTSVRFCTEDAYNPGTTDPLVVPATAGTNYSYKKTHYLNADTSPAGTINNIKWYTDGTIGWTGVTIQVKASTTYAQATGTVGVTGDVLSGGADASGKTSASPLTLTGSIANPDTGKISQIVETQGVVSDAAVAGTLSAETITFQYDET
jgi:hypothetical protein